MRALAGGIIFSACAVRAGGIDNEYRATIFPSVKLNDEMVGFGYLGYVNNPDKEYQTGYLGVGATYEVKPWLHLWGGLVGT